MRSAGPRCSAEDLVALDLGTGRSCHNIDSPSGGQMVPPGRGGRASGDAELPLLHDEGAAVLDVRGEDLPAVDHPVLLDEPDHGADRAPAGQRDQLGRDDVPGGDRAGQASRPTSQKPVASRRRPRDRSRAPGSRGVCDGGRPPAWTRSTASTPG
jgi:hypothetical protein